MKRFLRNICLACLVLAAATACDRPKDIPNSRLMNIFHDAFLANAYLREMRIDADSLELYEPIFRRYGYTIDDVRYTLERYSERKSSRLSDLIAVVGDRLAAEASAEAYKVMILDTIDNVAQRAFTRTIYADSLIRATRMRDTTLLQITVEDILPGEYTVSFDYMIDSLDKNRISRAELWLERDDSIQTSRYTTVLYRYRNESFTRKMTVDSTHRRLRLNLYHHMRYDKRDVPHITVRDVKVVRVLPKAEAVDSLYREQLGIRIFNPRFMIDKYDAQDSIALSVEPQGAD